MAVCVCTDRLTVDDNGRLCVIPGSLGLRDWVIYPTPGDDFEFRRTDYPWLARVVVRVQAAGGGSAGASSDAGELVARPGGAGGGYSESVIEVGALPAVVPVTVGAGGAPGGAASPGGDGGDSSFGALVVALGGQGGTANMNSGATPVTATGIAGPLAGTGDHIMGGGHGGGAIRLTGSQGLSGAGGDSHLGHGGYSRGTSGPGGASRGRGGGAGGALSIGVASEEGAQGGHGIVIVELYG